MKYILTFLLLLPIYCFGQSLIPFGGNRTTDTAYAKGFIRVDSGMRVLGLATSDTTKYLAVDGGGKFVNRTVLNVDSSLYVTRKRLNDSLATNTFSRVVRRNNDSKFVPMITSNGTQYTLSRMAADSFGVYAHYGSSTYTPIAVLAVKRYDSTSGYNLKTPLS